MKRQLLIAAVIFVIMSVINVFGAFVNERLNYDGSLADLDDTLVFVGIFCALYLLTTRLSIRLGPAYRLPLIRSIFWSVLLALDLLPSSSLETFGYLLGLINTGICLFWSTIMLSITGCIDCHFLLNYAINILLFGLYEVAVILIATRAADSLLRKRSRAPALSSAG